jgi:phenylacetate-CoA ligase
MASFTKRIQKERPRVLFGYASSLYQFAQFVRKSQIHGITFDGIISSAEVLPLALRQVIEETFQCRVFNRYGTKELGGVACECEAHQGLHISVENNLVEILDDDGVVGPGETGSLVVTNLNNLAMPFIRYSIGDEGAWEEGGGCSCGRGSPRLKTVEGRIVDQFITRDGRTSWAGFAGDGYSSLLAHPSIKQFQIIQESLDKITVLLVKDGEIPATNLVRLESALHAAFGKEIEVEFRFPDHIDRLPSGKHRYAVSKVEPKKNSAVETLKEWEVF